MIGRLLGLCGVVLILAGCAATDVPSRAPPNVLIFSHTTGYRHDSIEPATAAIREIARRDDMQAVASEDPSIFDDPERLAAFDAIILLSSTTKPDAPVSEWLVGERRAALQRYVRGGGGIVAIHAAADSHYHWPWYGQMIGARFLRHPDGVPQGLVARTTTTHPATTVLPCSFRIRDEWYWFSNAVPTLDILLTLDPASIGEAPEKPAPLAWAHRFQGGRVFYTGLGHRSENWSDARLLDHVRGGMRWAIGEAADPDPGRPPSCPIS